MNTEKYENILVDPGTINLNPKFGRKINEPATPSKTKKGNEKPSRKERWEAKQKDNN